MINSNEISELAKRLLASLPRGLTQLPKDVEKNFQNILEATFHKMDLVTRTEFDAQVKVVLRLRKKLEELEKHLADSYPKDKSL